MTTMNEDDGGSNPLARRCETCGQTRGWHKENAPRHPFNFGQDGATAIFKRREGRDPKRDDKTAQRGSQPPLIAGFAHDAVLRIALINAGVVTPAGLMVAEEQLREALMMAKGEEGGKSSEGPRRGEVQVGEAAPMDVGGTSAGSQEVGAQSNHQEG